VAVTYSVPRPQQYFYCFNTSSYIRIQMTFDLNSQMPRIGERAEILVTWYLRFNGFFPLPNFILHDGGVSKAPGQQLTEADLLAVRPPFTEEIIAAPDGTIRTAIDRRLGIRKATTEVLITEICSQDCKFNWLSKPEGDQRVFFSYALRRIGFWQENDIAAIVEHLMKHYFWESGTMRLRLLSFGIQRETSRKLPDLIDQITLAETLAYLQGLFTCYGEKLDRTGKYVVSDHHQWHPLVSEIYARLLGHKVPRQCPTEICEWLLAPEVGSGQSGTGR